MNSNHHGWITTFSGQRIRSTALQPSQVFKPDVTRGLAMQVRYLGQIRDFYSVAEHSVLVSRLAEAAGDHTDLLRMALLHDGHEYLTGDFPSPYKDDIEGLQPWEHRIERLFRKSMDLPPQEDIAWAQVKYYDLMALHFEARNLMVQDPGWIDSELVARVSPEVAIRCYDWKEAAINFRSRALQLGLTGF